MFHGQGIDDMSFRPHPLTYFGGGPPNWLKLPQDALSGPRARHEPVSTWQALFRVTI